MTYKKKLIEVALPLVAISEAGAREQSIKRGKPTQMHKWWAARPMVVARAILWASLIDDPSGDPDAFPTPEAQSAERLRLFSILTDLAVWESSNDPKVLAAARKEIDAQFPEGAPPVLDPFGGGGAIPLEAQRLGLATFSSDLNPVAVLLQRALLEIPMRFADVPPVFPQARSGLMTWKGAQGLAADVESYGNWLREQAGSELDSLYPDATGPNGERLPVVAWIWARTVKSPDPSWSGAVPLVSSWVVSKAKSGAGSWIEAEVDRSEQRIRYTVRSGGTPPDGTIGRAGGTCIATGAPIPLDYIREEGRAGRIGFELIAVVADGGRSRVYCSPTQRDVAAAECAEAKWRPSGALPEGGLGFRVQNYGLDEWWKLFTTRQLRGLTALSDLLPLVRDRVLSDASSSSLSSDDRRLRDGGAGPTAYADAIITYLAFAIDRAADWNNSLCRWDSANAVNQQLYGRQAVSMLWDFCEIAPHGSSAGSVGASLKTIRSALEAVPRWKVGTANVAQRDARSRLAEVGPCVVSTDPPYYDNIGYADLSDFFYVWLRRNLSDIWPEECATLLTPKSDEMIADPSRHGGRAGAEQHFESGMSRVMEALRAAQRSDIPATIYYAFKATESKDGATTSTGWDTFLQAILDSGMTVTATWPMRTENRSRLRALGSNALASSIVLACRPRSLEAPLATRGEFVGALRREMDAAIRLLQQQNIAPVDLAQSAIGPGIAIFSRYTRVVEADGSTMSVRASLGLINEILAEILSGEESEFDADTRFALTWFEQYGHNPGPFGDADLLARAKDTTVAGVAQAGVATSRDGRVHLVERQELPEGWDPAVDARLTVWETTQHLIRALESSESDAAALLARLGGGVGDRARQLAYLLYGICDRKKWAEDAAAYNMLVTAWPEISRLAASADERETIERLF